jgi:MFS family permease
MQTGVIATASSSRAGAFEGVTPYQWLVVLIASAGWLFDCMDQRIFILARTPALRELFQNDAQALAAVNVYAGYATTAMILGWATGGIIFGMMSDKYGRVKTMVLTLLVYSGFTGMSGLAQGWNDFIAYRFLAGIGVGGMFGAATALVAESVSPQFRPTALGILQALSAVGNIIGSLISLKIQPETVNWIAGYSGWRVLFFVGVLPALLVVPIIFVLKEPQSWLDAKAEAAAGRGRKTGSPIELFRHPRWRRNTIVGLFLGLSGMIGLWGIGFYSPELVATALRGQPQEVVASVRGWATALQDVGAFLGMLVFTYFAASVSRRLAFFGALLASMAATMFVFGSLNTPSDAYWMLPMMGFTQLAVFAGYSIYFPELFPTRLRGTGVGFCYNTVRYLAAPAPVLFGYLAVHMSFRTAAMMMTSVYVIGMIALIWAPETKGQPLPED